MFTLIALYMLIVRQVSEQPPDLFKILGLTRRGGGGGGGEQQSAGLYSYLLQGGRTPTVGSKGIG